MELLPDGFAVAGKELLPLRTCSVRKDNPRNM